MAAVKQFPPAPRRVGSAQDRVSLEALEARVKALEETLQALAAPPPEPKRKK